MAEEATINLRLQQEITKEEANQVDLAKQLEKAHAGEAEVLEEILDKSKAITESYKKNSEAISKQLETLENLGNTIENSVRSIPLIGATLIDMFGLKDLGEQLQTLFFDVMSKGIAPIGKFLMGPTGIAAAFVGIALAVRAVRKASFDLAGDLGVSRKEARDLLPSLKGAQMSFSAIGMDGSKIETSLIEIGKEFGSLENMTVANAVNIEKFAQNAGVAGSEVIKFNKVMMDLTGSSFDVSTNMAKTAVNMAKSANVSTSKVLNDMASNAEKFAEFAQDGADGFAKAAVEAAKVGSSVGNILQAATTLLDFESSITAQFKAQVLTGKQINTERARQLSLDGDIAGLTQEIQSIVGGVGDIQSLNVIQRKSVADAIGISVADLLRISRGEAAQQQETVQDKLEITNKLLAAGNEEAANILAATENNKNITMTGTTY